MARTRRVIFVWWVAQIVLAWFVKVCLASHFVHILSLSTINHWWFNPPQHLTNIQLLPSICGTTFQHPILQSYPRSLVQTNSHNAVLQTFFYKQTHSIKWVAIMQSYKLLQTNSFHQVARPTQKSYQLPRPNPKSYQLPTIVPYWCWPLFSLLRSGYKSRCIYATFTTSSKTCMTTFLFAMCIIHSL